MSSNILNFWIGFLEGVTDLLQEEPYIYLFGLYVGFLILAFIRKLMHIKLQKGENASMLIAEAFAMSNILSTISN